MKKWTSAQEFTHGPERIYWWHTINTIFLITKNENILKNTQPLLDRKLWFDKNLMGIELYLSILWRKNPNDNEFE